MDSQFNYIPRGHWGLGIHELPRSEVESRHASPQSGSHFVELLGSRIHYRDQGTGPAVVALHGICDSLHTWDHWTEILKDRYRIIRMDLPGFGLSTLPSQGVDMEVDLEIVNSLLNYLGVTEPVSIVGNSLGGYVAARWAAQFPNRAKSLTLLAPGGYPLPRFPWPIEISRFPLVRNIARRLTPKTVVLKTVNMLFGDKSAIRADMVDRWFDLILTEGNRDSYFEIFKSVTSTQEDFSVYAREIKCPTLLMWGTQDPWLPLTHAGLWQRDVQNIQLKIYPGCGHMPQLEIPQQSATDFAQFLVAGS